MGFFDLKNEDVQKAIKKGIESVKVLHIERIRFYDTEHFLYSVLITFVSKEKTILELQSNDLNDIANYIEI